MVARTAKSNQALTLGAGTTRTQVAVLSLVARTRESYQQMKLVEIEETIGDQQMLLVGTNGANRH